MSRASVTKSQWRVLGKRKEYERDAHTPVLSVFVVIVLTQFVSIISLNNQNDKLSSKLQSLTEQEQYYKGLYEEASSDDYAENFAKNEGNMKNDNETVYKGE